MNTIETPKCPFCDRRMDISGFTGGGTKGGKWIDHETVYRLTHSCAYGDIRMHNFQTLETIKSMCKVIE